MARKAKPQTKTIGHKAGFRPGKYISSPFRVETKLNPIVDHQVAISSSTEWKDRI